jgi:hypothetical protein
MRFAVEILALVLVAGGLPTAAAAQDVFVYPQKGQDAAQQQKDEYECHSWASNRTGFDPKEMPTATSAPPQQTGPGVVGTAVRGAAVGAVAGKIAGVGGGKGAGAGAAAGGMIGGMRNADQMRAEQQWADQQARDYRQRRTHYNRAFSACLEGRGYTAR